MWPILSRAAILSRRQAQRCMVARAGAASPSQAPSSQPPARPAAAPAPFVTPCTTCLPRSAKEAVLGGQRGCVVWFTGLSGSGKSAVATRVEAILAQRGVASALLDGDTLRTGLCAGLGFSADDRAENVRRVGEAAMLAAEAGLVALAALVSPYEAGRAGVRARCTSTRVPYIEVYMATPLALCAERDVKGLYAAARDGRLPGLTGTCASAPYEAPACPDVQLTGQGDLQEAAAVVIAHLEGAGLIQGGAQWSDGPGAANNAVPYHPPMNR